MRLNSSLIQRKSAKAAPHIGTPPEIRLSTGIPSLDRALGGGLLRGSLVEVWGAPSSGRTGLIFSVLAQATAAGEIVAYIDACHSLDPWFAQKQGIDLSRVLWIRCGFCLEKAIKAADIVARGSGFGVVVLDLEDPGGTRQHKAIPYSIWYRLRRIVEGSATVLLILGREPATGSAAQSSISFRNVGRHWEQGYPAEKRARYLGGLSIEIQAHRGKHQGHVTLHCRL